jgi:hypothetical protein
MRVMTSDSGFNLEFMKREGPICLVKRWKRKEDFHWEVVRIRYFEESILPNGLVIPAGERYPKSASWGTDGFTYLKNEEQAAEKTFQRLVRNSMGAKKQAAE